MSFDTIMPPYNASDPSATFLSSSCLDFLFIELVPMAYRVTNELQADAQARSLAVAAAEAGIPGAGPPPKAGTAKGSSAAAAGGAGLSEAGGTAGSGSLSGVGSRRLLDEEEEQDAVSFRLDMLGYRVGQGLVERFSRDRPPFHDTLDVIKFLCKDLWTLVFRKQVDNLKTNHRGVYVLTDNAFRPFQRMSTETGGQAVVKAQPFLWFPCGIVRGALAALGINATVQAESNELPGAIFQIKTVPTKPSAAAPPKRSVFSELPGQLTFTTSSLKKRKISRVSRRGDDSVFAQSVHHQGQPQPQPQAPTSNGSHLILPTTEGEEVEDIDFLQDDGDEDVDDSDDDSDDEDEDANNSDFQPSFSFSAASTTASSTRATPSYCGRDSSVPLSATDDPADINAGDTSSPSLQQLPLPAHRHPHRRLARSQSPLVPVSHRAIVMGGAADLPPSHRSSSPLKRPASSMDNSTDGGAAPADVAMNSLQVPPIEEQIRIIEGLVRDFCSGELQEGTTAYLVSRRWLAQAQALGSGDAAKAAKAVPQGRLGPVDNADIIEGVVQDVEGKDAVRLKPGTGLEDFELFPQRAWDLLVSWHGLAVGQLPIVRVTHNTAPASLIPNVQYELHPPVFTLHRLWSLISGIPSDKEVGDVKQPPPVLMCSSAYNMQAFLKRAKALLHIPTSRHVRLWRVPRKLPASEPAAAAAAAARPVPVSQALTTPPDSPRLDATGPTTNPQDSWSRLLLEVTDFMKLEANSERENLSTIKDMTHDQNYNGRQTLAFVSLTVDQTLVLDESVERNAWVSTYHPKGNKGNKDKAGAAASSSRPNSSSANHTAASAAAARTGIAASAASSGRSSPNQQGAMTRGRTKQKSGRVMGCVGLGNLGNTCYMNSALQCVRSVEELTKYFLVHESDVEINQVNPLGHGGNVAKAYSYLLDEIYKDNAPSSISPRGFKSTIGRYAPAFSGYGQQDSQEFLGFLLDGLQEDLSRVKKKPYIAKPDSTDEMIGNPAAIREMAEKVWDITKKRDDSVIADLFTGMYKSTLICPVCQKVSITFDPFTNLTLPLPIQNVWAKRVRFVPLNDRPINLDVELDKTSGFRALKEFVGARVGVPAERLVGAEELRDNIIKVFDDFACVSEEISNNDMIVVHEVEAAPTNLTASKMPRKKFRSMIQIDEDPEIPPWDSPLASRLLVPVMHRFDPLQSESGNSSSRRFRGNNAASPAHFIVLTPEEARSEDVIRRKILEKVASFSTWPEFAKADEEASEAGSSSSSGTGHVNSSSSGTEGVFSNISDADSAGSSKVTAKSVESEDDLVDVTMRDGSESYSQAQAQAKSVLYSYNHRRPKWVSDPSTYLPGELQNLFDMSYFDDGSNTIPIRWPGANDDKAYPKLHSRMRQPTTTTSSGHEEVQSPSTLDSAGGSENDNESVAGDAPTPEPIVSEVTRMADESEEEDSVLPAVQRLAFRHTVATKVGGRRKAGKANAKTYVTKGVKRRSRQQQQTVVSQVQTAETTLDNDQLPASQESRLSEGPADEKAPLVRIGEGIIVDWSMGAWEAVYGKDSVSDELRGEPTYGEPLALLEDVELHEKKRQRLSRRKHGLTLDECLDEFEREEILSENDTWYCPRCKEHRRASKKFDLWKTPDILVVHLKRFSSSGWRRDKLDTRVDFPVVGLDLTKRVLDRQTGKHETYDLIGVDDHWGGLGGGHYTAFARNFIDGQWYEYNDSSVSKVSDPSRVVSASAYLLFYRRRSDVPLGGPRFQQIADTFSREIAAADDDDRSDGGSGEGRRLGTASSLTGLSSASKGAGAGAALRHLGVGPGLASGNDGGVGSNGSNGSNSNASNNGSLSSLTAAVGDEPDYLYDEQVQIRDDDSDGDTADFHTRPTDSTNILNFGRDGDGDNDKTGGSRDVAPWAQSSWSFGQLGSGHDSTGSDQAEMDQVEGEDEGEGLLLSAASSPPPPDLLAQASMEDIQQQVWARKESQAQVHTVMANDDDTDQDSGKAVDIHVNEDETATE